MGKILITGMNQQQCTFDYYLKSRLQILNSHYSLVRCLRDMGYEVEQRTVTIGENLDDYEHVIVYIHNPAGFAGYVYNALWTINTRPDCILAFDDWQTESVYKGITSLDEPEKLFRQFIRDGHSLIPDNIEDYTNELLNGIEIIRSKQNRLLICAYEGGDLSLIVEDYPKDKVFGYNPNPYNLNRQVTKSAIDFGSNTPKERVFNFAGLIQDKTAKWLKHQKIEQTDWELKQYGSKKNKQERIKEPEMVNLFGQQWGILLPGYNHAGSGWWRLKVLQVADAGSIIIGEPKETIIYYGDEFLASIKAIDLVDCSDTELQEIARAQKEALYKLHPLDKRKEQEELLKCLNA